ncbi:Holliday junction resolvase RuvX [Acidocella sp.]|uniref:Holliday junction resolvase RuvX n=1 Tax=Acidocella sp. TaxID=50710 RepID=UPI00262597F4|nr:Holliday junction resolvase RuvX [Acidocella sp.]
MGLHNLAEFAGLLQPGQRLLALDPGSKRIGVALSDVGRAVASPYRVLARAKMKQNATEIAAICAREGVGGLVVGLALEADQRLGPRAQAARDWAHGISAATGLPVLMVDESLTSFEAHEQMIEAGVSRARRAEVIDKVAAAAILRRAIALLSPR